MDHHIIDPGQAGRDTRSAAAIAAKVSSFLDPVYGDLRILKKFALSCGASDPALRSGSMHTAGIALERLVSHFQQPDILSQRSDHVDTMLELAIGESPEIQRIVRRLAAAQCRDMGEDLRHMIQGASQAIEMLRDKVTSSEWGQKDQNATPGATLAFVSQQFLRVEVCRKEIFELAKYLDVDSDPSDEALPTHLATQILSLYSTQAERIVHARALNIPLAQDAVEIAKTNQNEQEQDLGSILF